MDDDRSLAALGLDANLGKAPWTYPGVAPEESGLLAGEEYLRLSPVAGRRLGQWQVELPCGRGRRGEAQGARTWVPLNYALLWYNQAPVGHRYPALAVGSNASPGQLVRKYEHGPMPVLPMTRAKVWGLAAGVSAHISAAGYVPATPIVVDNEQSDEENKPSDMFVCWPSVSQLKALDETERRNYRRLFLPAEHFPVELCSGEQLGGCYAYVSDRGCLLAEDKTPLRLIGQHELLASLLGRSEELRTIFGRTPRTMARRAAEGGDDLRERGRQVFEQEGWVGTQPELESMQSANLRYDQLPPEGWVRCQRELESVQSVDLRCDRLSPERSTEQDTSPDRYRVASSPDDFDRHGQANVRLPPAAFAKLGSPELVVVRRRLRGSTDQKTAVLARAEVVPQAAGDQTVEADQIVRDAVGVEIGEDVVLASARLRRCRWPERVGLGEPNYVTCRVQPADLTTMEAEVCLLDSLTLELLGLQSGDQAVVEGLPEPGGEVPQIRIKAFRVSEEVQQRRESLHGGDQTGRFPSSRDALGVFPDLPWVFLDRSTRVSLGLVGQTLGTVRMRASRRYQFAKELRELLLLIGLAFFGLVALVKNCWRWVLLGGLVALVIVVVTVRMRGRLTHTLGGDHRKRTGSSSGR
ncbi:hypothetical protein [Streptomyces sp. NPDC057579]|uniref:hypothetical protein n=1 Tax=Streptomyces sp. NPDC057579 TaxID=3346172 RepID=UPI0036AA07BF